MFTDLEMSLAMQERGPHEECRWPDRRRVEVVLVIFVNMRKCYNHW